MSILASSNVYNHFLSPRDYLVHMVLNFFAQKKKEKKAVIHIF